MKINVAFLFDIDEYLGMKIKALAGKNESNSKINNFGHAPVLSLPTTDATSACQGHGRIGLIILILFLFSQPLKADSVDFSKIVNAIYYAEGGKLASTPFGIRYKGCSWETKAYCHRICLNTIKNRYSEWLEINKKRPNSDFIAYLATKYAPLSDSPLNANWEHNVKWFLNHPKEAL